MLAPRHLVVLALVALGGIAWEPAIASACSCAPETIAEARERAAAIFEARVSAIEPAGDQLRVQLDVVQTWRAADHEHVTVLTAANSAACGYAFEVGRSYLVYASVADGELHVSLCGRTRPMEDADEDRTALGSGSIPVDVEDSAEEEEPPQRLARRGGCAGCAVGGRESAAPLLALAILAVLRLRRR